MQRSSGTDTIKVWPPDSREAAKLVIDKYGEPHEATATELIWHDCGPWKRIIASRDFHQHDFPAPHVDAITSVVDYRVPISKVAALAAFDGSVVVERTKGEVSAQCHDEEANCLALNLMHDIVTDVRTPEEARQYYAHEFLDHRRQQPTPYMDGLRFTPARGGSADADERVVSDDDLRRAVEQGEQQ
jgi:hypothetical protein